MSEIDWRSMGEVWAKVVDVDVDVDVDVAEEGKNTSTRRIRLASCTCTLQQREKKWECGGSMTKWLVVQGRSEGTPQYDEVVELGAVAYALKMCGARPLSR
jgi:hypothetical protein